MSGLGMEDVQGVEFVELENSKYLKPIRMKYQQVVTVNWCLQLCSYHRPVGARSGT